MTRIALLSPSIGNGNLGDEATVAAVIQNIRRRCPTATIYAFSPNPEDTRRRHCLPAFPITRHSGKTGAPDSLERHTETTGSVRQRIIATLKLFPVLYRGLKALRAAPRCVLAFFDELRFLATSFKCLKGTDLLIIPGSGVLSDHFGGPLNLPYTIFKWSLLAKATGACLAFLSVGAGPLRSGMSRRLIKHSISLGSYRSSRDVTSKQVLGSLGVPGPTPVFPDLANSLTIDPRPSCPNADGTIVGINPFPHCVPYYWPETDITKYQRYLMTLASFLSWLIHNKYTVFLFPTQIPSDVLLIEDLKKLLVERGVQDTNHSLLEFPIQSADDLTSRLAMTHL